MDKALSQVIDAQLEERSPVELACAYRAICGTMILRTALIIASKEPCRRDEFDNREAARKWVNSTRGVIRFAEACDALDVDPDVIRTGISRFAEEARDPLGRKSRKPRAHYVFGRKQRSCPGVEEGCGTAINTEASGDSRHGC